MSHERPKVAEAEAFTVAEGKMCGAAMRGADAPPGSKATSRTKGSCRNLGDLARPAVASAIPGHVGKSRRRSRRGTGEESDGCIVPMKPRTRPSDIGGGDGGGKATGRREGERQRGFPDTAPVTARHRSGKPTDWQRPYLPSRLTFDRSPVRESRSPGSVRGAASYRRPYRDLAQNPSPGNIARPNSAIPPGDNDEAEGRHHPRDERPPVGPGLLRFLGEHAGHDFRRRSNQHPQSA